ncbi:MAG TPA: hypothetical protein VN743_05485 [Blastocatellia bacterium]|nr:hypothetical protein [Blastocatellia bacterium]
MIHQKNKLPDMVIRRSGIWNSRAPFHNFLLGQRAIHRSYNVLTLAISQLRYDASQDDPNRDAQRFLKNVASHGEATAGKAWQGYKVSYGRDSEGSARRPKVSDISKDLKEALYDVREAAVVKYASLFESFSQCWALNLLLSKLENGTGWTLDERKLAENFSPVHGKHHAPGWPIITQRIPELRSGLSNLPHINKDVATGAVMTMPLSSDLNAFTSIKFWRDFRNIVVHSSGLITTTFFNEHRAFFDQLRVPYAAYIPPLELGQHLKFFDDVYLAMARTHYKAAFWMNNWLEKESGERRGHPQAPHPKTTDYFDKPVSASPLLVVGDHPKSYQWVTDSAFRANFL